MKRKIKEIKENNEIDTGNSNHHQSQKEKKKGGFELVERPVVSYNIILT